MNKRISAILIIFFLHNSAFSDICTNVNAKVGFINNSNISLQNFMNRQDAQTADIIYLGEHHLHNFSDTLTLIAQLFSENIDSDLKRCFFFEIDRRESVNPFGRFAPIEEMVSLLGFNPIYVDLVPEMPDWVVNFAEIIKTLEPGSSDYNDYLNRVNNWAISSIQIRDDSIAKYIKSLMSGDNPVCDKALGLIGGAHLSYEIPLKNRVPLAQLLRGNFNILTVEVVEFSTFLSGTGLGNPTTLHQNLLSASSLYGQCTGQELSENSSAAVLENQESDFDFSVYVNQRD